MLKYLEQEYIVVSDRFVQSSIVYQGIGRKLGADKILSMNELALQEVKPFCTYYLKIDMPTYLQRKQRQTDLDRLEQEKVSFFKEIMDGYDILFDPHVRENLIIDARKSVENTQKQILDSFDEIIRGKI